MPLFQRFAHEGSESSIALHLCHGLEARCCFLLLPAAALAVILGFDFIGRWIGLQYADRADEILPLHHGVFLLPSLNRFASL